MANIISGRGPRQFPSGPKPRFGRPVQTPQFNSFREQAGSAFNRPFNDSFEDIFGTGTFSFNTKGDAEQEQGLNQSTDGRQFDEQFGRNEFLNRPGFAFETVLGRSGLDRSMVDIFRKNAGQFLSNFQGELGRQILELGRNDLNPLDFFEGLNLQQEFQRLSPNERDPNAGQFNRASRILF